MATAWLMFAAATAWLKEATGGRLTTFTLRCEAAGVVPPLYIWPWSMPMAENQWSPTASKVSAPGV